MKTKLLISSGSKESLQTALNNHFYSTTYVINEDNSITWKNGELRTDLKYEFKRGRHRILTNI